MNENARLAKQLCRLIRMCASADEYRKLNLYDFINHDLPDTTCHFEMAAEVFQYTSINDDADGAWLNIRCVLEGIMQFLSERTTHSPTSADMPVLKEILAQVPCQKEKFRAWCEQAYS